MSNKKDSELALIGCRADNSNISYECCEYDIAVHAKNDNALSNNVTQIGKEKLEFLNFSNFNQNQISLFNMIKVENKTNSLLIPHDDSTSKTDFKRIFLSAGKRRAVDSLFNVSKTSTAKSELNLSLNLKIAAYELIEAILLISEIRPMPIHELNQLRQLEIRKDFIKEAIQLCIECIGIERATRTIINRSFNALKEIFKERYDLGLIESKIEFLVEHGLIADSYYYIGKLVCNHIEKKGYAYQLDYQKLNSIALDLASDYENIKRSNLIKLYCKILMKN
ncbi:MAG TPA: hypothetical protein VJM74_00455 [Nitrososphaeraceae archaeon]|nr:hypothetical protein [Nitrososphaeraceae archaeon]